MRWLKKRIFLSYIFLCMKNIHKKQKKQYCRNSICVQNDERRVKMFNSDLRERAIEALKQAGAVYNLEYDDMIEHVEALHKKRLYARDLLIDVENYINRVANKPQEFEKRLGEIRVRRLQFDDEVEKFKKDADNADGLGGLAGAGALAGAGVAVMGPTAAMAIATTFGTASTGVAISTLSGAAATKAALAWLGGGALSAGGAGMAAGQALLKLLGPAGWGLSAALLLGGGLLANSKNKEIAREAESKTRKIKRQTREVKEIDAKVEKLYAKLISELNNGIKSTLNYMKGLDIWDYRKMDDEHKANLIVIMNSANALSKTIGEKIK